MENMNEILDIICFLFTMPYQVYFALLAILCAIYLLLIGPALYKFWIIPKIELSYGRPLKVKESDYPYIPFANWQGAVFLVSIYIFSKYIKWDFPGVKRPPKHSFLFKLKEMNYDINKASRAEIVVAIVSMLFIFCLILSCAIVCLHKKY